MYSECCVTLVVFYILTQIRDLNKTRFIYHCLYSSAENMAPGSDLPGDQDTPLSSTSGDSLKEETKVFGGMELDDNGLPGAQGLYNPDYEKDACGVGFVVNINGEGTRKVRNC